MGRAKKFFKKVGDFIGDQFVVTQRGGNGDDKITGNNLFKNKLHGNGGDDTLKAFGARNELYGGTGDDTLRATGASNKMRGDEGNDELIGLGAHNDMRGGTNDDVLRGIGLHNDMRGDSGADEMFGLGAYNKMNGGSGEDTLLGIGAYNDMRGGAQNDEIRAIGGVNNAYGEDGDDKMLGLGGVNLLDGGEGNDIITAVGGVNKIKGGEGKDDITAVGGVNVLEGGNGNDKITAVGGVNSIFGDAGKDNIVAVGGVNVIDAGSASDQVVAVGGINTINGGDGDDVLISAGGVNVLNGDQGDDLMVAAGLASVMNGGTGDDVMVGVSAFNVQNGEDGDDVMVAIGLNNVQTGGAGEDKLFSVAAGLTFQHGGSGDDLMVASGNLNVQVGGDGNDIAVANGTANVQAGGAGNDLMVARAAVGGNLQLGGSDDDVMLAMGNVNIQVGNAGSDTMLALGIANVQFGGNITSSTNLPEEASLIQEHNSDLEIQELRSNSEMQDDLEYAQDELDDEHQDLNGGADTETNSMIAVGLGNVQVGDAADDIGIGLGVANLQLLGGGDDIAITGGIGNIQLGQDGEDLMVAGQTALGPIKVSGTLQLGGNDNDTMVTVIAPGAAVSVGIQNGQDGDDTLAMLSTDFRYADMLGALEVFKSENAKDLAKKSGDAVIGELIDGTTLQIGGGGDDMFFSAVADLALRSGGSGDDTFLNLIEGGFADGGAGDDIMVGGLVPSSIYTGGFGADAMLDFASYARIVFDFSLLEAASDFATHAVENLLGLLETYNGMIDGFDDGTGGQMGVLTDIISGLGNIPNPADFVQEFVTTFQVPAGNNFVGGEGDDVFGIASTSTNAIGGLGDDTFIVHLDAVDGAAVNDGGNGLGDMAEFVTSTLAFIDKQEKKSSENATDALGGDDVLVLRDNDGITLGDVTLTLVEQIDAETGAPALDGDGNPVFDIQIDVTGADTATNDATTVTLTGITDTDARIENIRLHHDDAAQLQQIDVAAAFDAGAFTLDQPISASALSAFATSVSSEETIAFDAKIEATFEKGKEVVSGLVDDAQRLVDAAVNAVDTVKDIILPTDEELDHTDLLTEEQAKEVAKYSPSGAGADEVEIEDFGQYGEVRTGDIASFKSNTLDVKRVETTETLALTDGSILLLYAVELNNGKKQIHGQRMDSSGNLAGDEFKLEGSNSVDVFNWEAKALDGNRFAVRLDNFDHQEMEFLALAEEPIRLPDPVPNTHFIESKKSFKTDDGKFVAISRISQSDDGKAKVEFVEFEETVASDGSPHILTIQDTIDAKFANSNNMRQSEIVELADGGFVVVSQNTFNDRDLAMQIFNEDGTPRTDVFFPASNLTRANEHSEPKLAALADGSFVLVYNKDEGDDEIHVVRLSATGEQIGEVHIIEGARAHPSVAATDDGRVVISYSMPDGELKTTFKLYDLDFKGTAQSDFIEGGNGDDFIEGGSGEDILLGGLGDDTIIGNGDADFIEGGLGNDVLSGRLGDDIIGGGAGDDILTGGSNNDIFFFDEENGTSFGNDTITDFTAGEDLIDLLGVESVTSFDDLLLVQDGADTIVKVLDGKGEVATEKVFLLDGVEVSEEEAQDAIDAADAANADGTTQEGEPELEIIDREINTIRLRNVDADTLEEDNFAHASNTVGEHGTVELDHEGFTIETLQTYEDPIVVAFVKTNNGVDFVEVRVSEVTSQSFHIKLQEAVNADHVHTTETVSYMVVERGTHELSNGAVIHAGSVETKGLYQDNALDSLRIVKFGSDALDGDSHVFATVNTDGGGSMATARVNDVNDNGFRVSIAKSEKLDFELVKNGNFSDGGSHWTSNNPTGGEPVLFANGAAHFNRGNETVFGDSIQQDINTYEGAAYTVSLDLKEVQDKARHDFRIEILNDIGQVVEQVEKSVSRGTTKEVSFEFTATSDGSTIRITNTGSQNSISSDGLVDNVSVKEVINSAEKVGFIAFQDAAFDGFSTSSVFADHTATSVADSFDFAQITDLNNLDAAVVRQDIDAGTVFVQEETSDTPLTKRFFDDEISLLNFDQDEGFFLI